MDIETSGKRMNRSTAKSDPSAAPPDQREGSDGQASFAETALKLGGKSDDEARRTGAIDKADDQVEQLFAKRFQTVNSPVHRAVWERELPIEEFASRPAKTPPEVEKVMQDSLAVMRKHVKASESCMTFSTSGGVFAGRL